MVLAVPIRVGLDAHAVGRRQTGNETYIVEVATALARRDDVDPVAYIDGDVAWPRADGPEVRRLRSRSRYLRIPVELPLRVRQDHVQLLHVQYVSPPLSPVPIVAIVHDVSFLDLPEAFPAHTRLRMRATIGLTVRRAAMVLTGSAFSRDRLVEAYRLPPERVAVTPYGVDSRWRPLPAAETAARLVASGLVDLPERYVLAIGNLQPRKNIPRLVRAVAAVRANGNQDLGLVLVGQRHWGGSEVEAEIERTSARAWVHAPGYLEEATLVALMNRADVVAYPSLYEGFGFPVLEALACGAVVVAGNRTSIPEVAGNAAYLVDPASDDALASAILNAATDRVLRGRLAAAGPRWASAFTWERCAELTVRAYGTALRAG